MNVDAMPSTPGIAFTTSPTLFTEESLTTSTTTTIINNNATSFYRDVTIVAAGPRGMWRRLPGAPGPDYAIGVLVLSVLALVCSSLVLIAMRYATGGRGATLVFMRSLCLSDILMAMYGTSKAAMLLHLEELHVNFFLPEGLFFTASLASSLSLLVLNVDCFMKLTRPFKYFQVDKDSVITAMLFMWNATFIAGFLPLLGWSLTDYTVLFFSFYTWHYLTFTGLVLVLCLLVSAWCLVSLARVHPGRRRRHHHRRRLRCFPGLQSVTAATAATTAATTTTPESDYISGHGLEVRKYRRLHRAVVAESVMWVCCYVPFVLYVGLVCPQCPLSYYRYRDSSVLYFIPVFLLKALLGSALRAYRVLHLRTVLARLWTVDSSSSSSCTSSFSVFRRIWRRQERDPRSKEQSGVASIAYTNSLCVDHSSYEANEQGLGQRQQHHRKQHHHKRVRLSTAQLVLHRALSETESAPSDSSSSVGVTNLSFRASLDLGEPVEDPDLQITAL